MNEKMVTVAVEIVAVVVNVATVVVYVVDVVVLLQRDGFNIFGNFFKR